MGCIGMAVKNWRLSRMPRGGRRGRFWQRFHRDNEPQYEEIHVPPPPPPPNVDSHNWRWSFSTSPRQGGGSKGGRRLKESASADGSPPRTWSEREDDYDDVASVSSESQVSATTSEICFICGDLLSNHPEVPTIHLFDEGPLVPTIHLCDKDDYGVSGKDGRGRGEGREAGGITGRGCSGVPGARAAALARGRRAHSSHRDKEHRRAHSVGGPISSGSSLPSSPRPHSSPARSATLPRSGLPPYASSTKSKSRNLPLREDSQETGSQDTLVFSPDEAPSVKERGRGSGKVQDGMESIHKRLRDAQDSLEGVRSDLHKICFGMKSGLALACFGQGEEKEKENDQGFTENLLNDLQDGLKEQYDTFISQVKQGMQEKSRVIETEVLKIKAEKEAVKKQLGQLEEKVKDVKAREDEVEAMRQEIQKDREQIQKDNEHEKAEIRRQWQKLQDEIKRMEEIHNLQQGRIKLDVGGHVYTTSMSTLTKDSESMLAAMFSGRHELRQEEDGTVFIDRDGTHFRYILNYLRDGLTEGSLPDEGQALRELLNEAVYYQITGLVEAVEERLQSTSI